MQLSAPTWHNSALVGDFAQTVLMPGDPKRAAHIARTHLENAVLVNDLRGVQGYTGFYRGKRVSVMASGMGMPSIAIYAHELYQVYGVQNILRIGTAGAISPELGFMDVIAGTSASTDSNFAAHYGFPFTLAPTASFSLLLKAHDAAKRLGYPLRIGPLYCSDTLYDDQIDYNPIMQKMHVLACDMESAALYLEAMRAGKDALCLLTIVDDPRTGESASPEARETSLGRMIEIALEIA
ncbi:MAG: purine-nucleoside phosphorylase [Clostridia bacterium]